MCWVMSITFLIWGTTYWALVSCKRRVWMCCLREGHKRNVASFILPKARLLNPSWVQTGCMCWSLKHTPTRREKNNACRLITQSKPKCGTIGMVISATRGCSPCTTRTWSSVFPELSKLRKHVKYAWKGSNIGYLFQRRARGEQLRNWSSFTRTCVVKSLHHLILRRGTWSVLLMISLEKLGFTLHLRSQKPFTTSSCSSLLLRSRHACSLSA